MKTIKNINIFILTSIISLIMFTSCGGDYLDVEPTSTITSDRLKELGNESPEAFLEVLQPQVTGLYSWMIQYNSAGSARHNDFGHLAIMLITDLMNEDMLQNTSNYGWYYDCYDLSQRPNYASVDVFMPWNYYYKLIKSANDIIALFSEDVTDKDLLVFKGQALAMRAFGYYYLVQLYQHTYVGHEEDPAVPIVTETTTAAEIANNPRAKVKDVYELILSDLTTAYDLLKDYTRASKVELDQQVVAGLLARTYLNMEDGTNAAKYAKIARQGYTLSIEEWDCVTGTGFVDINEPDWMWGADVNSQTRIATSGIVNPTSHLSSVSYGYTTAGNMQKMIDAKLYSLIPSTDLRKKAFADSQMSVWGYNVPQYANLKFGTYNGTNDNFGDCVLMRAAEMYLIEAEGLCLSGDNAGAQNVLYEFVSTRDQEAVKSSATGSALRNEIYLQRRIELWGEGFSYFDHKRLKLGFTRSYEGTNHREDAMYNKGPEDDVFRFRIPRQEIINNNGIEESDNND
ncbi:MAG: RagB/SusD family nutrient uptake outer membrane protein [Dysgonamonadaceae bacterium]|jgi:hypothetical protein|nr:RagB/SusD family nutrient uptake outer membrane protein [Dysgonamonadaceae bacterium]